MTKTLSEPQGLRSLLKLAAPLIVSFWVRSLFTLVDTLYASFLSDNAIAAIGLVVPFEFTLIAIWVGTSAGLTSYISKGIVSSDPRNDYDIFIKAAWHIIYAIVPLFAVFAVLLYFLTPYFGLEPELSRSFQIYGAVILGGTALTGFWSIIPDSIIKAHHDTRSTMIAGMLSNFLNLALNTFFLFVMEWGIFGIAFSTVLGRFGGLSYAIYRSRKLEVKRLAALVDKQEETPPFKRSEREALLLMLKLAVPSALTYTLIAAENLVINGVLSRLPDSTSAIAAFGVYHRVLMFSIVPMIATSVALLPFIARLSHKQNLKLIRESFNGIILTFIVYALLFVAPIVLLFSDQLINLLTDTDTMQSYGNFALSLVPIMCLVTAPYIFCKPVLEGLQRPKPVVLLGLLRYLILSIPLALLGAYLGELSNIGSFPGLMSGIVCATIIASITAYTIVRKLLSA